MNILIIAAMPSELSALTSNPPEIGRIVEHRGKDSVTLATTGWGKVNTAIATTRLLYKYKPDFAFMVGICGAITLEIPLHTLCIIERAYEHDVDATPFAKPPLLPEGQTTWGTSSRPLHDTVIESLFNHEANEQKSFTHQFIAGVKAATGDQVIRTINQVDKVLERVPGAKIVDMESAAFLKACNAMATPAISLRVVTDYANESVGVNEEAKQAAPILAKAVKLTMQTLRTKKFK